MSWNGLILINKPAQVTSHDVVQRARKVLGTREVGHAGTLDPLATGLMVLLVGEGTKLSDFVLNGEKAYRVRVRLGLRTDSLDVMGEVLKQVPCDLDPAEIKTQVMLLQGTFQWPVPAISATKIMGKKMYEWTRDHGAQMAAPVKEMTFWGLNIEEVGKDYVDVYINCSKGSFIRSWASQLGENLGVGGTVERLERDISAPYSLEQAADLETLDVESAAFKRAYIPMREALPGLKTLTVQGKDQKLLLNGQISHDLERRLIPEQKAANQAQKPIGIRILSADRGELLSLLEAQPNRGLKIKRVFKNAWLPPA